MDATKPGKTMPDTSARPVVITHRPMVQDPMVKSDDSATELSEPKSSEASSKISVQSHGEKVIQPDAALKKSNQPVPSDDSEPEKPQPEPEPKDNSQSAVVDAVADEAEASITKKDGQSTEAETAQQEHLQKLTVSKTYFLPLGQVSRRRNRRAALIIIVFLVLAAGSYWALDSQVISNNIKLPYHFIKN